MCSAFFIIFPTHAEIQKSSGIIFAFSPFRLDNITHLQYASQEWLPFVLYAFIRFFRERKKRWAFAAAGFLWLQAMSCITYMVMFSVPLPSTPTESPPPLLHVEPVPSTVTEPVEPE